jgi:cytochrome c oxidase subunit 2
MNELLRKLLFLPPEASSLARSIDRLHYFVIGVTMLGAFGVTLLALAFVIRYRARTDEDLSAAQPPAPTIGRSEVAIIAGLATLFLLWWLIGIRQYDELRTPPAGALVVYTEAKQWMWKFDYPGGRRSIDALYVPVGRAVRVVLGSRDVIHSFYVPAFRVKQDVVPGRTTVAWFRATEAGDFPILCAELCGAGHSIMRGRVVALAPKDYERWLASQPVDLIARGERVAAEKGCLRCHTLDGTAHIGPTWAGLYGHDVALSDGTTVRADEAYITESMMEPNEQIVRGFRPVMPTFQGLVDPADTAAIIELIRSLADRAPVEPVRQVEP